MKSILLLIIVLSDCLQNTECVLCFSSVNRLSGRCEDEVGEVKLDDCCQNSNYGYLGDDGVCRYCGPLVVSSWSSWSRCSVLCGDGSCHRTRKCFGLPEPDLNDPKCSALNRYQTRPCNSTTCCSAVQWGEWSTWGACSVLCGGGGGAQQRQRECPSDEAGCVDTCVGEKSESQPCVEHQPCPVHGTWGSWGAWTTCSATCVSGSEEDIWGAVYPTRSRNRLCDSPAPSSNTVPPGNTCPGENYSLNSCSDLPNCPVDGGWGSYGPPGPCSVTCGEGLQLSVKRCDTPTPKYGGKPCGGASTKQQVCDSPCPVHGGWTGWSSWSECSTSCFPESRASTRTRHRSCTSPAPSSNGNPCVGDERETGVCEHLSHCAVDGGWGAWGPYTSCPVTCGVGLRLSVRDCNSPAFKHGGLPCQGDGNQTIICKTDVLCPVDGVWTEWSDWSPCMFSGRSVKCKSTGGTQNRNRRCEHRDNGGKHCAEGKLTQTQGCYDITGCSLKGTWEGWGEWSPCKPSCGQAKSIRFRDRICNPDLSGYRPTIGKTLLPAHFHGTPDCGYLPRAEKKQYETCIIPAVCPP